MILKPILVKPGHLATPEMFATTMLAPDTTVLLHSIEVHFAWQDWVFDYCTNNTWFDSKNLKLKVFKYEGKKWNGPFLLNDEHFLLAPTFSADGRNLYILLEVVKGGVSESHRTDTEWNILHFIKKKLWLIRFYENHKRQSISLQAIFAWQHKEL